MRLSKERKRMKISAYKVLIEKEKIKEMEKDYAMN